MNEDRVRLPEIIEASIPLVEKADACVAKALSLAARLAKKDREVRNALMMHIIRPLLAPAYSALWLLDAIPNTPLNIERTACAVSLALAWCLIGSPLLDTLREMCPAPGKLGLLFAVSVDEFLECLDHASGGTEVDANMMLILRAETRLARCIREAIRLSPPRPDDIDRLRRLYTRVLKRRLRFIEEFMKHVLDGRIERHGNTVLCIHAFPDVEDKESSVDAAREKLRRAVDEVRSELKAEIPIARAIIGRIDVYLQILALPHAAPLAQLAVPPGPHVHLTWPVARHPSGGEPVLLVRDHDGVLIYAPPPRPLPPCKPRPLHRFCHLHDIACEDWRAGFDDALRGSLYKVLGPPPP